jgi:hypothetical protein
METYKNTPKTPPFPMDDIKRTDSDEQEQRRRNLNVLLGLQQEAARLLKFDNWSPRVKEKLEMIRDTPTLTPSIKTQCYALNCSGIATLSRIVHSPYL